MAIMNVYNQNGEIIEQIELSSDILETTVNENALHQVVVMQLANKRVGTASTKRRDEVSGSGRKLFRQKGTGMARAGSRRSPLRIGGGVVFGPKPRDYGYKVPKKIRRLAIKSALADKFQSNDVIIVDSLNFDRPKTKQMINVINNLNISNDKKILFILGSTDMNVLLSARNIPRVNVCVWNNINTYDILWHDKLVFTQEALRNIEDRFCGEPNR
ncbi:MAG: 50S ribosomal protein L4 [bacterium]